MTGPNEVRLVKCRKLGKELPGLAKPPYKNELGKRIYDEVSKEAWDMWIKDSVKYINTYRVDLTSIEGQKFMFDQAEVYFGFKQGELANTAFVPQEPGADSDSGDNGPAAEADEK